MVKRRVGGILIAAFILLATASVSAAGSSAFLRILQLANDGTAVSVTLADGRTILTNLSPGSASDYIAFDADTSTFIRTTILPTRGPTFIREWSVPPLTPGHHTAVLVGAASDNSLEMTFIDEDNLCVDKLDKASCVILVNSIRNSPTLTVTSNSTPIVENAGYRQVAVGSAEARSYATLSAVDQNNPQNVIFRQQFGFFEPNVIYLYSLMGSYPGTSASSYQIGTIRRVPVDSMTFLRGLTADLQLSDGTTLYATENIVSILEQSGLDQLLSNNLLPLTVFAPTDGAALQAAASLYQCALSNTAALRELVLNHILVGSYNATQLVNAGSVSTLAGTNHSFRATADGFIIDNSVPVSNRLSYPTTNGMVYLTNSALVPPGFASRYCS